MTATLASISITLAIAAIACAALSVYYARRARKAAPGPSGPLILDVRDLDWPEEYRRRVCGWLRAHGLDPEVVVRVEVRGHKALVIEYVRDADGDLKFNRRRDGLVMTTRTVAVAGPPPLAAPGLDLTRRWTDGTPAD